jgi:tyrosinase
MADQLVRQDVWTLEQDQRFHPVILAYALAVREMRTRQPDHPTSWAYQTAVHWTNEPNPGPFFNQCQHNTWFFLPWHRMFLYWFEQIVRSVLRELPESVLQAFPEVDEQTIATWALPYWDYWDPRPPTATQPPPFKDSLPSSFRATTLPNGDPNPLFEERRNRGRPKKALGDPPISPVAINRGARLPSRVTSPHQALNRPLFVDRAAGFGGPVTSFHHFVEDQIRMAGALELTPHGAVHNTVGGRGGLMTSLRTSPGDPIFWLHHANLDRLWEVWLGRPDPSDPMVRTNPTDDRWRDFEFDFKDARGQAVSEFRTPSEVVDLTRLGYRYADVSWPAAPLPPGAVPVPPAPPLEAAMPPAPPPDHPPELVGATEQPLELRGELATVRFPVARPTGPLARTEAATPSRVFLYLDDITGDENPGVVYAVYANVPDDDDDPTNDAHYVGTLSFFGIEDLRDLDQDHAGGLRVAYDITDLYTRLRDQGRWNERQVTVTFEPLELVPAAGAEPGGGELELEEEAEVEDEAVPPVTVGRVSLFLQ